MASFRYAYQKIVDLKSSEKTQAEWQLSSAIGVLQAEELSLAELRMKRAEWESKQHESSHEAVSLAELQLMQHYLEYLDSCIASKLTEVRQAERKVEFNRSNLADRMKDEKVWLKAKEHAKDRFRHVMQIKEQNELDEMATVRFKVSLPS
ncbi:flagellar export protein FliJ [Paenibacillus glycanilyticus]|uniref:flagellar export protein FliJ n=1 Tax=Paenibacillus glycanilyticus TaxID=126569 RepID=UPI00203F74D0|nr:flagellar export protein FliJ [Paenibacillus glycanilyticus]MCM3625949.1 flagellar export protein FliJ [Paenibacillus glycanilyticus]